MRLRITGGAVHDPANGVDGDIRDICVEDGRIVESLPPDAPKLDARGMVVMPGGVDVHSHFASSSCNHARRLIPDEHTADPVAPPELSDGEPLARSGSGGTVPSTFTTGYRYAGLGYTTAFDAAVAPLMARHSHAELDDTPCVDGGIFVLMGNDEYLLRQIQAGERDRARDYAAWLLGATGGYAIKVVNPGGVEAWKTGQRNVTGLDDSVGGRATPRAIVEVLADAANALQLPHPVHIHCNNLGIPGNAATTLATMDALTGRRAHLTHLQFHCYGGEPGKGWSSGASQGHGVRQRPSGAERRRGAGDVRSGDDDHGRRAGRISALQEQRQTLDQHRYRARDGVRHRPAGLQGQGRGGGAAMGDRPRDLPAERRPLACGALDRPPQRRVVPLLSGPDPAPDGPVVPRPAAHAGESEAVGGKRAGRRAARGNTRSTRSRSSPAPGRPDCSDSSRRAISARARTPTSRSTAAIPTSRRCSRPLGTS